MKNLEKSWQKNSLYICIMIICEFETSASPKLKLARRPFSCQIRARPNKVREKRDDFYAQFWEMWKNGQ
jgi:murein L,D-transpeptidase YafK